MGICEELILQKEYDDNHDGLCILTDRTDDDEDDYVDDDDDDDTKYMMMHDHYSVNGDWRPVGTLLHRMLIREGNRISWTGQQIW